MASKIRVYGQAQNRTALGIVHAYMRLNPDATIEDLRRVFPDELAPDKGVAEIFVDSDFDDKGEHYFTEAEELIDTADGRKVAVAKHWSKPSYANLVRRAADHDIEVAEFEQQQHVGQKGSYYLEYVNGYRPAAADVPPVVGNGKNRECLTFLWVILGILLLLLLAALVSRCCRGGCSGCETVNDGAAPALVEETTIVAVDGTADSAANVNGPSAAYTGTDESAATAGNASASATTGSAAATTASAAVVAQVEKYQEQFDAIEYPVGEYRLKPGAKAVLDNLAALMKDNPDMRLTVNGYASREGNPEANQVLSDKRAASVVDYLVSKGVAASRLKAVGLNSSDPISSQLAPNRRVDFVVR